MRYSKLDQMIKEAALELFTEQQNSEKPKEEKSAYEKTIEKYDEKKAKEKEAKEKKAKEGPKTKKKVGEPAIGRGNLKRAILNIREMQRRDPAKLLKDLGVSSASGATDLDKAASVLRQAISNNPIMADAYVMPTIATSGEKKLLRVPVKTGARKELNTRNANKFVYLTLAAAEDAGLLMMKDGIDFLSVAETDTPTIFGR